MCQTKQIKVKGKKSNKIETKKTIFPSIFMNKKKISKLFYPNNKDKIEQNNNVYLSIDNFISKHPIFSLEAVGNSFVDKIITKIKKKNKKEIPKENNKTPICLINNCILNF